MPTCIIVGGGSSVSEGIKKGLWDKVKHLDIAACNNAVIHMPYIPKYAVYIDKTPLQPDVIKKVLETDCIRVTQLFHDFRDDNKIVRFKIFHDLDEEGKFERALERGYLFAGKRKFTGVFAISFALYAGYDRIYLLGFDWNLGKNKEVEWYHDDEDPKHTEYKRGIFIDEKTNKPKTDAGEHFDIFKGKATIYNVSLISAIPSFPKISYNEFFNHVRHLKEE